MKKKHPKKQQLHNFSISESLLLIAIVNLESESSEATLTTSICCNYLNRKRSLRVPFYYLARTTSTRMIQVGCKTPNPQVVHRLEYRMLSTGLNHSFCPRRCISINAIAIYLSSINFGVYKDWSVFMVILSSVYQSLNYLFDGEVNVFL